MNDFSFSTRQADDLLYVVPAKEYVIQKILSSHSPFVPASFFVRTKIASVSGWMWITEKLFGSNIYVENDFRELFFIDSRIRFLLISLMEKKIVSSWVRMPNLPDLPPTVRYSIKMNPHRLPSGRTSHIQGNRGDGTGDTPNQALLPALAETLERQSLCVWDSKKIVRGSFENLRHRGAVRPSLFVFFSEKQLDLSSFARSLVTPDTEMDWVLVRSFISEKKHLAPAQLVYLLYSEEHRDEPYFGQPTTSGAAAGVSFDQATYRAICEAIERDGLFNFWLNGIAPPVIDLESIPFPKVREYVANIKKHKLELFILDITTDLEVPSFCAVLIDRFGKKAVSMSAVADFDVSRALEKLMLEVLKFPHFITPESGTMTLISVQEKYPRIETLDERSLLWSQREMIPRIEFFLQGKKKDFSEINVEYARENIKTKLRKIKDILKEKRYNCFLTDVTSQEARQAGLSVVKAILPQLVPAYFNERDKPLGVKRLFTLPVTLGYRTAPLNENELNPIPHPFL